MSSEEVAALLMQNIGATQLKDAPVELGEDKVATLHSFINAAYAEVGLEEFALSHEAFVEVVERKLFTNEAVAGERHEVLLASYKAEYIHAAELIQKLASLDANGYIKALISLDKSAYDGKGNYRPAIVGTRIWHFRKFFLDEFVRYAVNVLGGFAADGFGLQSAGVRNYRGYVGGPFSPDGMPYRVAGS